MSGNGIRTATAALPYLGKAATAAVDNAQKSSWFTRKNKDAPEVKKSWFTRKAPTPDTTPEEDALAKKFLQKVRAGELSDVVNSIDVESETKATPEEEALVKKFLQKVKAGELSDVVKSINEKPKKDEDLTVFQQIKQKMQNGDVSAIIKSIPSPPPIPAALVVQIITSLKEIFDTNIGKVGQYANAYMDNAVAKKKTQLRINNELAELAKGDELKPYVKTYIDHSLA